MSLVSLARIVQKNHETVFIAAKETATTTRCFDFLPIVHIPQTLIWLS